MVVVKDDFWTTSIRLEIKIIRIYVKKKLKKNSFRK